MPSEVDAGRRIEASCPPKSPFGHDPENARAFPEVLVNIRQLEETQRAVALFRTHPEYAVPNFTIAVGDRLNSSGAARANKI